jgi:hypothetical protein
MTAYAVILSSSFYHYSLARATGGDACGTADRTIAFSLGFAAAVFLPAFTVILYRLCPESAARAVRVGFRAAIAVLTVFGYAYLSRFWRSHEHHVTLLVQMAIVIGYFEVNKHCPATNPESVWERAKNFGKFSILVLIVYLPLFACANRYYWPYMLVMLVLFTLRASPLLLAVAFLVGREIPPSARMRHAVAGCCLFLCGCTASEIWIHGVSDGKVREYLALNIQPYNHPGGSVLLFSVEPRPEIGNAEVLTMWLCLVEKSNPPRVAIAFPLLFHNGRWALGRLPDYGR